MTLTAFHKYVQEVKQRKQYEEQSYVVAAIERKQKMPGRGGGERRFFREMVRARGSKRHAAQLNGPRIA